MNIGQDHLLTLTQGHLNIKFKGEILFGAFMLSENKSLYVESSSHDQHGLHTHIW